MIHFSDEDISTEYSALMSKVMTDGQGKIKFPINEPAEGKRKSQIEEYLEFNHGPGRAAHRDRDSSDIVATVEALQRARRRSSSRRRSRTTRRCPSASARSTRTGPTCGGCGILADRDDDGYLLQIFTKTAQDRPTLFFEVIERHGARGFGDGQLQGAVRSDRARAGAARQPLGGRSSSASRT